ncbi:hypothetical protein ANCCAN_10590 [Ancylostoma caninum]|uniref:Uncharacterized protein n=1 Tax=Ancylostoma caninum TaxID=29170 RepID=A0A368GJG0_ANCCA|nr:hypothetical protein ANCCAN_10590 [Ancylostoma caninum]
MVGLVHVQANLFICRKIYNPERVMTSLFRSVCRYLRNDSHQIVKAIEDPRDQSNNGSDYYVQKMKIR